MDHHVGQRGPVPAGPGDRLTASEGQEKLDLLGEQAVVVAQFVSEQSERLGERAPAGHDLGPATRE
jgi:hypothetical protein